MQAVLYDFECMQEVCMTLSICRHFYDFECMQEVLYDSERMQAVLRYAG